MTNIILCGGSGTRLWPISRTLMPKQFVKLFDNKSLFQLTVNRNSKICDSQYFNFVGIIQFTGQSTSSGRVWPDSQLPFKKKKKR